MQMNVNFSLEKEQAKRAYELYMREVQLNPAMEGVIGDMFSSLSKRIKNMYAKLFKSSEEIKEAPEVQSFNAAASKVNAKNFLDISSMQVASLEGFQGYYKDYALTLVSSLDLFPSFMQGEIKRIELFLADVTTNHDAARSFKDLKNEIQVSQEKRKQDDQSNEVYWKAGSFRVQVKVSDLIRNSSEMQEIKDLTAQMNKHIKTVNMDQLISRIGKINDTANHLADSISKGTLTHLNKQQATNIGEGLWELALLMEHYAITRYRVHAFMTAVERLGVALKAVL